MKRHTAINKKTHTFQTKGTCVLFESCILFFVKQLSRGEQERLFGLRSKASEHTEKSRYAPTPSYRRNTF